MRASGLTPAGVGMVLFMVYPIVKAILGQN